MSKNKKKNILLAGFVLIFIILLLVIFLYGKENKKNVVIGMITTGSIDEPGWNRHHYLGLKKASEEFNVNIIVKQNVNEFSGECVEAVEELIDKGAKLIILGSYNYQEEVSDLIEQNPEICFYGASSSANINNISTYFVRVYQARYLAGIVAGKQTQNNKIGYVAAMPNSEVYRGINAFALGVLSVNPDAQVYVKWTGNWNDEESERVAAKALIEDAGVDLITYHQNQDFVVSEAEKHGIYSIGYHEYMEGYSEKYLTAVLESWENVYNEILKEYMQGKGNSSHMIWLGLEKDAVGLAPFTNLVSDETRLQVEEAKQHMINGWKVFSDNIVAEDGTVKCHDGEVISDDVLFSSMDWFVKGVSLYEK